MTGTARADRLRATNEAKLNELFAGKKLQLTRVIDLAEGKIFRTSTGQWARRGYILRDTDTGDLFAVGPKVAQYITQRFPDSGFALP